MNRYLTWFDLAFSLILAYMFACAPQYIETGSLTYSIGLSGRILVCFMLFSGSAAAGRLLFRKLQYYRIPFIGESHLKIKCAILIFVCWLPMIICLYPGTLHYDSWMQIKEAVTFFRSNLDFTILHDHHPVMTTLLFGGFFNTVSKLTGNWQAGFFLYVLIQEFFTAYAFACTIHYAKHTLKASNIILIIALLFYCFLPVYPAAAQTIVKDSLFSWIYIHFSIEAMELVRTKCDCLEDRKFRIRFIITVIAAALTKKIGVYVIIPFLFIMMIVMKNRKQIMKVFLICAALTMIIIPKTIGMLGVVPGGSQEKYSMIYQQTARYVKYHEDELSEHEYGIIDLVIGMEDLPERYDPIFADNVKGYVQRANTLEYLVYFKTWFLEGLNDPKVYWDAAQAMLSGWFSFYEYKPLMSMERHVSYPEVFPENIHIRPAFFEKTAAAIRDYYDRIYHIPVIGLLLTYGLYASILPSFVFSTLLKYKKNNWLHAIPMILSIGLGCWLAPASVHMEGVRYLYPVVYTIPLMMMYCSTLEEANNRNP